MMPAKDTTRVIRFMAVMMALAQIEGMMAVINEESKLKS